MAKTRRERCPNCGFLEVIKWGRRGATLRPNTRCNCCSFGRTLRKQYC